MTTSGARYVRLGDRDAQISSLRARFGEAAIVTADDSAYAAIVVITPSLQPDDDLADLSREFGEAFSVQTQTIADLLVYDHFRAGKRTRGLTYAGEAGWQRVVGEPEAWEQRVFFAQARLEEILLELEDDTSDAATLEREAAELRRLWAGGRLEEGNSRPAIDLRAVTRAITQHQQLPVLAQVARPSSTRQKIG
jgi:hypothetical protein